MMVEVLHLMRNSRRNVGALWDATRTRNARVVFNLLGPAIRGYLLRRGSRGRMAEVPTEYSAHFNWDYGADNERFAKLDRQAKRDQWDAETDVDWSIDVDIYNEEVQLFAEHMLPLQAIPQFRQLPRKLQLKQTSEILGWLLSQFLHGEQGALFAACQLTEAVEWMDGKLYGSTQVVDEGRHVEVFKRYLLDKLGRIYDINDNLYVIIDALMTDSRWDMKFLGMQIMVEGLALGAFGALRQATREPLLSEILRYVITDEARHVHFGVIALEDYYRKLSPSKRREREDWAFEMALLMRNRFLAHEFYDEYWGHAMSRRQWERLLSSSDFMQLYRRCMFRRIIPNLKRIGLLSPRIRPYYQELGVLEWEHHKAAPELTRQEMLARE